MTREEREDAIDIIQSILDKYEEDECLVAEITIGDEDIEALKLAIKALEQETCEDKIIEWKKDFKGYVNSLSMPRDDYKRIMEYIDELPVTPQPKTGK